MTLLSLKKVSLKIDQANILNQISFDLMSGEIFGLIGESGCGKSLTASSIIGLLPEDSKLTGEIILNKVNLIGRTEKEMNAIRGTEISIVFQEPMKALNPLKTIKNQVLESILVHSSSRKKDAENLAIEKLKLVGLNPSRISPNRFPHELSGGQRQRVMIAIAIAKQPKLLIADEPTTALDVTTQSQILKLLQEIVKSEEMALLIISHDLAVISNLADRVAIMKNGKIVDQGKTEVVFTQLSQPYTKQILFDSFKVTKHPLVVGKNPLLDLRSVTKAYKTKFSLQFQNKKVPETVLNGVDFTLYTGECLGLVGESGCGKSTLARSIMGLETLNSGTITIDKLPIKPGHKSLKNFRQKLQIVFQDPYGSFNPRHRIQRIIVEPLYLKKSTLNSTEKIHLARKVITDVGLDISDLSKFPHQFSGGQRQRIAIARAIIIRPKLIILDEALSALDVSLRNKMIHLLQELSINYDLSYLFISHDIELVRSITNRVLIMNKGQIVEMGDTETVLSNPQNEYTKKLISSIPKVPKLWFKTAKKGQV